MVRPARNTHRQGTRDAHLERVIRAMLHIENNLGRPAELSLENLARRAHMSRFHFQRVFADVIGESPKQYARRLGLERAARRLRKSSVLNETLAREVGFASSEPFVRAFREMFGCPPAKFARDAIGRRRVLPAAPRGLRAWRLVSAPGTHLSFATVRLGPGKPALRVDRIGALRIACVRKFGSAPTPGDFARLFEWAGERRVGKDPMCLALSYDDDLTPPSRRRFDACIAVPPRTAGRGSINVRHFKGADVAVATHAGAGGELWKAVHWSRRAAPCLTGRVLSEAPAVCIYLGQAWKRASMQRPLHVDILLPLVPGMPVTRLYFRRHHPTEV